MHSFQITFCDYTVFPGRENFISRFGFRDKDGEELTDAVGIIFIELTKLGKALAKPVGEMTLAEMWGIFFKYADSPRHRELISAIASAKGEIHLATRLLTSISKDADERARFHSRRIYEMDMAHTIAVHREEGIEEGLERGLKQGIERGLKQGIKEGIKEGKIEMAIALVNDGDSVERAARIAGVSAEELKKRL
jgi:predicted transposase/invertase (TIGR01784 family)